ncbi:MAG: hypothetical protein AB7F91_04940 [Parvularculaceae bacterium]
MIQQFLILAGLVGVAALLFQRWSQKIEAEIAEGADYERERLEAADPNLIAGLSEERFRAAYRRTHYPRFPKYALAIAAAFVASLPLTLGMLAGIAWTLDSLGMSADAQALARSVPIEGSIAGVSRDEGETIALYYVQDVVKFYYYFGLLFIWLGIIYVAMRHYHKNRPGYLRDEIDKEKSKG